MARRSPGHGLKGRRAQNKEARALDGAIKVEHTEKWFPQIGLKQDAAPLVGMGAKNEIRTRRPLHWSQTSGPESWMAKVRRCTMSLVCA